MRAPMGLLTIVGSFALTSLVLGNAYLQKKQFYPSVVYITKSNPSMAVLYIQAFVFVIILAKLMRKVFFGQLRAVELEHLIERSWYAVTETCLAFTVFRDDFSTKFVAMFTLLLFLKCFHWLAEDRIDYMESSPVISWLFHVRAVALLSFLGSLDMYFIEHAYHSTLTKGASVQLVFGFEYAILTTVVAAAMIKYILHAIDLQSEIAWDNKAVYLLYTELVVGGVKVVLYSAFMIIMIKVHTFPLFAIRPMYLTLRTFKKALNDVVMSRRAIRNMNNLYPDATEADLQSGDNVCIICREEMTVGCKKLPCNHIFHTSCLRSWFQRQQTCPTCRMDVLRTARPGADQPAQPQQQQQQQPAQAGNVNQFAHFQFWQPGAFQQPAPAPAPAGTPSSAATGTTPTAAGTSVAGMMAPPPPPPFMMPPFGMMAPPPLPFTTPLPMPSGDFAGLTDEELADLEGRERANIEARIKCLRNIQVLLDAAVIQMNQYSQVVANLQPFPSATNIGATSTTTPPGGTSAGAASGGAKPKTDIKTPTKTSGKDISKSANEPNIPSKPAVSPLDRSPQPRNLTNGTSPSLDEKANVDLTNLEGAVGFTPGKADDIIDPSTFDDDLIDREDVNEIRRRRLHRFSLADDNKPDEKQLETN